MGCCKQKQGWESYTSHQKFERRIRGWKQGQGKGNEMMRVGENEPQDVGDSHSK